MLGTTYLELIKRPKNQDISAFAGLIVTIPFSNLVPLESPHLMQKQY